LREPPPERDFHGIEREKRAMALVAQSKAPPSQQALERILANVRALGLEQNLIELETLGYTVLKGVLTPTTIERAKEAILGSTERFTGTTGIDIEKEDGSTLKGMTYVPRLLYDDPVFEEVLMEEKPLALVTYLLGESCLLSSMGCHFRVPGGLPLMLHSDNGNGTPAPYSNISYVANVNYALTPYSKQAAAPADVGGEFPAAARVEGHAAGSGRVDRSAERRADDHRARRRGGMARQYLARRLPARAAGRAHQSRRLFLPPVRADAGTARPFRAEGSSGAACERRTLCNAAGTARALWLGSGRPGLCADEQGPARALRLIRQRRVS
jgi:hypothetical protein